MLRSLDGLSTGDAFGQTFYGPDGVRCISSRETAPCPWRWTDDTHMALSIAAHLLTYGSVHQDELAQSFARHFVEDGRRGYAGGAAEVLSRIYAGEDWRLVAANIFPGGSYGNGGAMRAAPIGGFFYAQPDLAAEQARLAAEITHAHPEGQAGAMAVAAAAALAASEQPPRGNEFLNAVIRHTPASETQDGIRRALSIPEGEVEQAARELGTGRQVSAQDTVPFCLWVAAHNLDHYKEALWVTVSGLGDRDTTCAIVGGIVALSAAEIPAEWLACREPLPSLAGF
jgi:ADP-ribosylglycohydrolase